MYGSDQPYVHYRVIGNFVLELPCTYHVFTKGSDWHWTCAWTYLGMTWLVRCTHWAWKALSRKPLLPWPFPTLCVCTCKNGMVRCTRLVRTFKIASAEQRAKYWSAFRSSLSVLIWWCRLRKEGAESCLKMSRLPWPWRHPWNLVLQVCALMRCVCVCVCVCACTCACAFACVCA